MNKEQLKARAEYRRKLAQQGNASSDSLVAEIGAFWLQKAKERWNPKEQKQVPPGVPVGDAFIQFVKDYMKRNNFRTLEFGEDAVKAGAEAIARWIDYNGNRVVGLDYPNPLDEVEKAKGEGFVVHDIFDEGGGMPLAASSRNPTKKAHHIYGPVSFPDRHRNMYDSPEEWTRYSPENPGIQMKRIGDGIYQDPISGAVFEYQAGVVNQTNIGWNDSWPQPGFLTSPNQQSTRGSGGIYEDDSDADLVSYGDDKGIEYKQHANELYANEGGMAEIHKDIERSTGGGKDSNTNYRKREASVKRADTEYGIADNLFGPVQTKTRYSPDHPGVQMIRVSDDIYQDPITRKIYDFAKGFETEDGEKHLGGSVAEMTPDWPEYYQSPHPFVELHRAGKSYKGFTKVGQINVAYKFANSIILANRGEEHHRKVLGLVADGIFDGKPVVQAIEEAYRFMEMGGEPEAEAPTPAEAAVEEEDYPEGHVPSLHQVQQETMFR